MPGIPDLLLQESPAASAPATSDCTTSDADTADTDAEARRVADAESEADADADPDPDAGSEYGVPVGVREDDAEFAMLKAFSEPTLTIMLSLDTESLAKLET